MLNAQSWRKCVAKAISIPDLFGLVGSAIVIVAYFANVQGMMRADGWPYYVANIAGAGLILISLIFAWNLPAAVVEIFWGAISIYGVARAALKKAK
jgi:hypothetical protein